MPDYECVRQCLTFRGENLPDVLNRVANYIAENPIIQPDLRLEQHEEGEYLITLYGEWEHIKFKAIAGKNAVA